MNVLDLFSGIGGFSLGLERAGMRTVAFCEVDPFCRRVLARHWPSVPCYDDVRTLTADRLRADGISVDVICGGFPCQDISIAGKGAGITGERSGLWSEYARIIGELRPRFVIVENVAAILGRGIERVLGDLAALGFDAEWHCIPASSVGAPHRRDRWWAVAYAHDQWKLQSEGSEPHERRRLSNSSEDVADTNGARLERWLGRSLQECFGKCVIGEGRPSNPNTDSKSLERATEPRCQRCYWRIEPDVGRVAHGVPSRVDRLRALGNAVVPQIPEIIGRAIMSAPLNIHQREGK